MCIVKVVRSGCCSSLTRTDTMDRLNHRQSTINDSINQSIASLRMEKGKKEEAGLPVADFIITPLPSDFCCGQPWHSIQTGVSLTRCQTGNHAVMILVTVVCVIRRGRYCKSAGYKTSVAAVLGLWQPVSGAGTSGTNVMIPHD